MMTCFLNISCDILVVKTCYMTFNGLFPVRSLRTGDRKITTIKESIPVRIQDQLSSVEYPVRD